MEMFDQLILDYPQYEKIQVEFAILQEKIGIK